MSANGSSSRSGIRPGKETVTHGRPQGGFEFPGRGFRIDLGLDSAPGLHGGQEAASERLGGSTHGRAIGVARTPAPRRECCWDARILFFSLASAIAIWSGYNMLKLRNYWLALAGSVALMPGSCMCCLLGLPSGIWSIVVLVNPEVKSAFR